MCNPARGFMLWLRRQRLPEQVDHAESIARVPESRKLEERGVPRLLFTPSASRAPCSFATGLDSTRRQHQQRAIPRTAPRPSVGQIWSGHATVTAWFVRSYTAQDRLGTRISGGLGLALASVRFRRSGKHSSPPRADFASNLRIPQQYIRYRPESGCFQVWVVPSVPEADSACHCV